MRRGLRCTLNSGLGLAVNPLLVPDGRRKRGEAGLPGKAEGEWKRELGRAEAARRVN